MLDKGQGVYEGDTYIRGYDIQGNEIDLTSVRITVLQGVGPSKLKVEFFGALLGGALKYDISAPKNAVKGTYFVGFGAPGFKAKTLTVVIE